MNRAGGGFDHETMLEAPFLVRPLVGDEDVLTRDPVGQVRTEACLHRPVVPGEPERDPIVPPKPRVRMVPVMNVQLGTPLRCIPDHAVGFEHQTVHGHDRPRVVATGRGADLEAIDLDLEPNDPPQRLQGLAHGGEDYSASRIAFGRMRDQAYFVGPPSGPGPGILFLPSWWGLTSSARRRADFLSDAGFTVLAPDLALGERPETEEEAEAYLGEADPNRLASLVMSSATLLAERSAPGPLGVVGVGMGGSLGLWLSVRRPELVSAAVSLYGSQVIDFAGARADYQIHLAEDDRFISEDEAAFMEATIGLESLDVTVERYPGTHHGFADPESPAFDPDAADLAWNRARDFLRARL